MAKNTIQPLFKKYGAKIFAICFWLFIWEIVYRLLDNEILLVSPFTVIKTIVIFIGQPWFWQTIGFTFIRIGFGFFVALITGIIAGVLSYVSRLCRELIMPVMKVIKSTPVASFIILSLVWIKGKHISIFISYLMVLPIIYSNVYQGIVHADKKLLEMASVFQIGLIKKLRAIYLPSVMPYFITAVSVGLGFCFKAGIAAEVIALTSGSIGKRLYEAKLYFVTNELFAWTVVIIVISVTFEKLIMYVLKPLQPTLKDSDSIDKDPRKE